MSDELRAIVEAGFKAMHQRHDDKTRVDDQRHAEVLGRLDKANSLISKAHDRSAKLEASMSELQTWRETARVRIHKLSADIQSQAAKCAVFLGRSAHSDDEGSIPVTWTRLRMAAIVIIGIVVGTIAVLRFLEVINR